MNNSRGKQSSIPPLKTRPDSPVPTLKCVGSPPGSANLSSALPPSGGGGAGLQPPLGRRRTAGESWARAQQGSSVLQPQTPRPRLSAPLLRQPSSPSESERRKRRPRAPSRPCCAPRWRPLQQGLQEPGQLPEGPAFSCCLAHPFEEKVKRGLTFAVWKSGLTLRWVTPPPDSELRQHSLPLLSPASALGKEVLDGMRSGRAHV